MQPPSMLHRAGLALAAALLALLAACAESPLDPGAHQAPEETTTSPASPPPPTAPAAPAANPLEDARLYVDPYSRPRQQADAWRVTRPQDAALMDRIAAQPQVRWLGDWNPNVRADADQAVTTIAAAGALPVFVAYNIPLRDCGSYSAGGARSATAYREWIGALAEGIGSRRAVVILEPDALAGMDCLSAADREARVGLIRQAVETLKAKGRIVVYVDAGNALWHTPETVAARLRQAGIERADGFSLNVSNFLTTGVSVAYGEKLSGLVGGKHFVVDTGRNGAGPTADLQWCNPAGRALGTAPTTRTGHPLVDAFLWIKAPGESDGECNGGPAAGAWWPEYALGLAQRAYAPAAPPQTQGSQAVITVTFDDGWASAYTRGFPVLREHGLRGNVAVVTESVDYWTGFLTLAQLRELHQAGWSMVSHSVGHGHLTRASDAELERQLAESKRWLRAQGFRGSSVFVVPYHDWGARELAAVKKHYKAARGYTSGNFSPERFQKGVPADPYQLTGVEAEYVPFTTAEGRDALRRKLERAVAEGEFVDLFFHDIKPEQMAAFREAVAIIARYKQFVRPYHEVFPD